MKLIHLICAVASLLVFLFGTTVVSAQQSFQLSSKFYEAIALRGKLMWDGKHHFGNVFCLTFPRSSDSEALAEAMYNNNTLYFSRVVYKGMMSLYVVRSTVPKGRSVEEEIGNLEAQNKKSVDAYPRNFMQSRTTGLLGPSLILTVRNAIEGRKNEPFPFVRSIITNTKTNLTSLSVHRLFVHDGNRIEVAGLRYYKTPIDPNREAEVISELSAFVEAAAESLQTCTAKLPPRKTVGSCSKN